MPFLRPCALLAPLLFLSPLTAATAGEGPAVVVVGLGEPLLAGEAEALVEEGLKDTAVRLVDERGLPDVDATLGDRQGPLSQELVDGLRRHADALVLVRADYLGVRTLNLEHGADVAHQGRVTLTLVDLRREDVPPRPLLNQRVEYTHLTVTDALRPVLRPARSELLAVLGVR